MYRLVTWDCEPGLMAAASYHRDEVFGLALGIHVFVN
jgi:hypothetical protein